MLLDVKTGLRRSFPTWGHSAVDTICYFNEYCGVVVNVAAAHGSEVLLGYGGVTGGTIW